MLHPFKVFAFIINAQCGIRENINVTYHEFSSPKTIRLRQVCRSRIVLLFAYVSSTSYFFPDSTRQKETVVPESAVPSKVKNTPLCMKF